MKLNAIILTKTQHFQKSILMIEDLKDELFAMFWGLPCFLQILRTGKYFGKR